MTDYSNETLPEFEFSSKTEARDELDKRIEDAEMIDELFAVIDQAADVLINDHALKSEVDHGNLSRDLKVGYSEWICRFIDAGAQTPENIPVLIDDIRNDPVNNSQIVLGRMTDRSQDCMLISRESWGRQSGEDHQRAP